MKDCTIVGAGLAGLLLAEKLIEGGLKHLTLIDSKDPFCASNAPLAICHPFPGRSLKPHPLLHQAYALT